MAHWSCKATAFENVDEWAVDLVVNEGVHMNLSRDEWTLVAGKLVMMGLGTRTIGERLHLSNAEAEALTHRWRRMKKYWKPDMSELSSSV